LRRWRLAPPAAPFIREISTPGSISGIFKVRSASARTSHCHSATGCIAGGSRRRNANRSCGAWSRRTSCSPRRGALSKAAAEQGTTLRLRPPYRAVCAVLHKAPQPAILVRYGAERRLLGRDSAVVARLLSGPRQQRRV
jgi:hypothetical protein